MQPTYSVCSLVYICVCASQHFAYPVCLCPFRALSFVEEDTSVAPFFAAHQAIPAWVVVDDRQLFSHPSKQHCCMLPTARIAILT